MSRDIKIQDEHHTVLFDPKNCIVTISGVMRLNGLQEYAPITALLSNTIQECQNLSLDLLQLEFLNSSGIAMLSKFVIEARKQKGVKLTIRGSKTVAWQSKSLVNLQRLMPALELTFE